MSDKIQRKLGQENLSPVLAVFLRFLLVFYGLLDEHKAFGKVPENDSIPVIPRDKVKVTLDDGQELLAMDRAAGTDLSEVIKGAVVAGATARATLGERVFEDMLRQRREHVLRERTRDRDLNVPGGVGNVTEYEHRGACLGGWHVGNCDLSSLPTVSAFNPRRPNDLRRFDELSVRETFDPGEQGGDLSAPEVHIDLGELGTVAIPVPEGARSLEVDPHTFTIQWTMQDRSVLPVRDLRDYMASLPRRQMGGFIEVGYCTPSRRPVTGRDTHGRLQSFRDIGHFTFSDGSPVSYGIDHNGIAVRLEQGETGEQSGRIERGERGDGPRLASSDGLPMVVGRTLNGRLALMNPNGELHSEA